MEKTIFKRAVVDEIARYLYTEDIIVLHGARQVGKTSIMIYLQRQLIAQGEQTIYLDLEDSRLTAILDRGVEEFLRYLQEEGADLIERSPSIALRRICPVWRLSQNRADA